MTFPELNSSPVRLVPVEGGNPALIVKAKKTLPSLALPRRIVFHDRRPTQTKQIKTDQYSEHIQHIPPMGLSPIGDIHSSGPGEIFDLQEMLGTDLGIDANKSLNPNYSLPSIPQLEQSLNITIDPNRTINTNLRIIYFADSRDEANSLQPLVIKVDRMDVEDKAAQERVVINNMVYLLMRILGEDGIPFMYDSGRDEFVGEDGKKHTYSYTKHEEVQMFADQDTIDPAISDYRIVKHPFGEALLKLRDFDIEIPLIDYSRSTNYGEKQEVDETNKMVHKHQAYVDDLWLTAEDFLTLPVIKGVSRILGTIKDKKRRKQLEFVMGGYLQQLFQISDRHADDITVKPGELSQRERNLELLREINAAKYADEILHGEVTVFTPPSFPIAA